MPLHVSSICAHHQEVKIALHSLRYHHTYRWPSSAQVDRVLSQPVHETVTYRCDDTRGCVMQFWPPHDEHMCSKHVEAWYKLIVKQKVCASSWLITKINFQNNLIVHSVGQIKTLKLMCSSQQSHPSHGEIKTKYFVQFIDWQIRQTVLYCCYFICLHTKQELRVYIFHYFYLPILLIKKQGWCPVLYFSLGKGST